MFKLMKKIKDKLDNINLKGEHKDSIKKKTDVCDRILSGETFFDDRRHDLRRVELERREA